MVVTPDGSVQRVVIEQRDGTWLFPKAGANVLPKVCTINTKSQRAGLKPLGTMEMTVLSLVPCIVAFGLGL